MDAKIYSVEKACFAINKSNPPQLVIHATGTVNSSGWSNGRLAPWVYVKEPDDGIQDFDFIATAPTDYVLWVMSSITGDIVVTLVDWMKGFRIHTSSNKIEVMLDDSNCREKVGSMKGTDIPWPL